MPGQPIWKDDEDEDKCEFVEKKRRKIPVKLQSALFYLVGEQNLTRNDLKLKMTTRKMMIKWSQWRTIK